jgi:hypothetical protein
MVEKILLWPPSGSNVHSKVRAKTKEEAEKVGKYMIRPLLSLERLSYEEPQGQVSCRTINHLKLTFIAHRPPPPWIASQELLMAAEAGGEYFS